MNRLGKMAIAGALVSTLALTGCSSGSNGSESGETATSGGSASAAGEDANLTAWFMRDDVPEAAQQWLKDEWSARHDGAELTIEIQDWDGIVTKLQTTLASESQTPDLVEFGNTQVLTFASAGALSDISDMKEELGGDSLIPSLVESGSVDGKMYAAPFFAGSRVIYYRKSLFEAAGLDAPKSLSELTAAAAKLQELNPEGVEGFEGIFLPAKDWGSVSGWFFTNGNRFAELEGDKWVGTLSTESGQAAMKELQTLWTTGSHSAASTSVDESRQPYVPYNEGRTAIFSALNRQFADIDPELQKDTGVIPLPGIEPGTVGNVLAGGSNIGVPAKSANQTYARELLAMTFEPEFQTYFASEGGWVPGNIDFASPLEETEVGQAEIIAVENATTTPAAPKWGVVESNDVMRDMLTKLAQGADPVELAAEYDATIEQLLND